MNPFKEHAKVELDILTRDGDSIIGERQKNAVLELVAAFAEEGQHSGGLDLSRPVPLPK